jgi:hypothetical protein
MSRKVQIAAGKHEVTLPNGEIYDEGAQVILTDEEWQRVVSTAIGDEVIDLGPISDSPGGAGLTEIFIPANEFHATGAGTTLTNTTFGLWQWSIGPDTNYTFDVVLRLPQDWQTFDIYVWYSNQGGDTDNYVTWSFGQQWYGSNDPLPFSAPPLVATSNVTPPAFGAIGELQLTATPQSAQAVQSAKLYNLRLTNNNSPNTSPRTFCGARLVKAS